MNLLNLLPDELLHLIYKRYFSDHVLNCISKKCFWKYSLGQGRPSIRCNLNTIDSAFCVACWYNFHYL